jgi:serine/threonine-protein kinase
VRAGDVVEGKYRLVRELGAGAQARVWEAEHVQLGTPLAVKLLDPSLATRPDYVTRFKREAAAAASLRSPNVVQIFDFGVADDSPFIAMELLEGEDLAMRLERVRRLPPEEVAAVITQVARALGRAHNRGIVHRDLKPDNIYLCSDEEGESEVVKVLDFGIAKGINQISLARTGTGVVLGTPYYMSPEQAEGVRAIDHRSDLWSLGVIAFEAMVGARPFLATNLGNLLVKICAQPPPVPSSVEPQVPVGFDDWFLRACARRPEDRFGSAKEMATTLALICGHLPAAMSDSSYITVVPTGADRAKASRSRHQRVKIEPAPVPRPSGPPRAPQAKAGSAAGAPAPQPAPARPPRPASIPVAVPGTAVARVALVSQPAPPPSPRRAGAQPAAASRTASATPAAGFEADRPTPPGGEDEDQDDVTEVMTEAPAEPQPEKPSAGWDLDVPVPSYRPSAPTPENGVPALPPPSTPRPSAAPPRVSTPARSSAPPRASTPPRASAPPSHAKSIHPELDESSLDEEPAEKFDVRQVREQMAREARRIERDRKIKRLLEHLHTIRWPLIALLLIASAVLVTVWLRGR